VGLWIGDGPFGNGLVPAAEIRLELTGELPVTNSKDYIAHKED